LLHGDTLCTEDVDYQQFRRKVRDPKWQRLALSVPLFLRKSMARKMRADALRHSNKKPAEIMDVTQEAVEATLVQNHVWQMIHGHTHRPAIHDFILQGQPARRIVLGDWYQLDSVLVCDSTRQRLLRVEELLAGTTS
jgi:UDP-2,3-diacylglucosamine hydrolase